MKRFFITGTDTDCGKTYASCQLLDFFKEEGYKALAIKPVASGARMVDGHLQSEDVINLQRHNSDFAHPINYRQFRAPISPHLAAKAEGERLSLSEIEDFCQSEAFSGRDYLIIEGAGGLLVPLNEEHSWLDFLKQSQIPVILIVGMRLGCLNHALLSDFVLRTNEIETVGWIANCIDEDMLALEENIISLRERMSIPMLGRIGYQGKFEVGDLEADLLIDCPLPLCSI